jgi:hypothetical protein
LDILFFTEANGPAQRHGPDSIKGEEKPKCPLPKFVIGVGLRLVQPFPMGPNIVGFANTDGEYNPGGRPVRCPSQEGCDELGNGGLAFIITSDEKEALTEYDWISKRVAG